MTLEPFFDKFDQFADAPNAVAKMRELVLELAATGRLNPAALERPVEEDPKERKGYKIVFDESAGHFGLATTQMNGPDVFIGLYGSFMETLESM